MRDMAVKLDNRPGQIRELVMSIYALEAYLEVERGAEARREYRKILEILVPRCTKEMEALRERAEKDGDFLRSHQIVTIIRAGGSADDVLIEVMTMVVHLGKDFWYAGA